MGDLLKEVVGFCSHAGILLSETAGLKTSSSSDAFDLRFLEQFESLDATFHTQSLEAEFGPKIDQILARNSSRLQGDLESLSLADGDSRLKLIAQEVTDSPQFQSFKSQMVMKAKTAVAIQLRSGLSLQPDELIITSARTNNDWFSSSTTDSMYDYAGSFGASQSGFMFGRNYLTKVMAILDSPSSDLSAKENILKSLRQMSSVDIGQSEDWDSFMTLLKRLLLEEVGLTDELLRFLSKMFNSQSPHVLFDVYSLLTDHMAELKQLVGDSLAIDDSMLKKPDVKFGNVLKKAKLLHEFQMALPNSWFRYPEKLVEQIVKKTVDFMFSGPSEKCSAVDSTVLFALVDGDACWWRKWTHSDFARSKILACLQTGDGLTHLWNSLASSKGNSAVMACRYHYCLQLMTTACLYLGCRQQMTQGNGDLLKEILTTTLEYLTRHGQTSSRLTPTSFRQLLKGSVELISVLMIDRKGLPKQVWSNVVGSLVKIYDADLLKTADKLEIFCLIKEMKQLELNVSNDTQLDGQMEKLVTEIDTEVPLSHLQTVVAQLIPMMTKMPTDRRQKLLSNCIRIANQQSTPAQLALLQQLFADDEILEFIGDKFGGEVISELGSRLKSTRETMDVPMGIFIELIDRLKANEKLYQMAVDSGLLDSVSADLTESFDD